MRRMILKLFVRFSGVWGEPSNRITSLFLKNTIKINTFAESTVANVDVALINNHGNTISGLNSKTSCSYLHEPYPEPVPPSPIFIYVMSLPFIFSFNAATVISCHSFPPCVNDPPIKATRISFADKSIFLLGRYSFDDYYLSFMYKLPFITFM